MRAICKLHISGGSVSPNIYSTIDPLNPRIRARKPSSPPSLIFPQPVAASLSLSTWRRWIPMRGSYSLGVSRGRPRRKGLGSTSATTARSSMPSSWGTRPPAAPGVLGLSSLPIPLSSSASSRTNTSLMVALWVLFSLFCGRFLYSVFVDFCV